MLSLGGSALRADDWVPSHPAKIQAVDGAATGQTSGGTSAAQVANDSPVAAELHATRLKWRPYRPDRAPAAPGAEPVHRDARVVQAQAIQSDDPLNNPFGDASARAASTAAHPAPPAALPASDSGELTAPSVLEQPRPAIAQPVAPPAAGSGSTVPAPLPTTTPSPAPTPIPPTPPGGVTPPTTPGTTAPYQPRTDFLGPNPQISSTADEGCVSSLKACNEAADKLAKKTIDTINIDISLTGKPGDAYPCECVLAEGHFVPRSWPMITYTWKASALCHKPLYFEDVQQERYGHSHGPFLDPVVSAAHFFVSIPLLPYYMGVEPPCECEYSLGYYRPGDCAPFMMDPFPLSCRGAAVEAGVVTGAVIALP